MFSSSNFSYLLSLECLLIINLHFVSLNTCKRCKFFFKSNPFEKRESFALGKAFLPYILKMINF